MKKPFNDKEKNILLQIADALYPKSDIFPFIASDKLDFDIINRYFENGSFDIILGFKAILFIINMLFPLIFLKKPVVFSKLSLEDRIKIMEMAEKSKNFAWRYLVLTSKTIVAMFYFENDEAKNITGFDGKCLDE